MLSADGLDARKHAEYIATIASRVESVQRMLEQLFEYARIEANELTLASEPVGLNNILRDVVSLFYDDFCAKDEQPDVCIPDEAFVVRGDADALRRVFTNILHNSLLHGDGAFSIHSERRGGACVLCFANRTHSVSAGFIQPILRARKRALDWGSRLPKAWFAGWAAISAPRCRRTSFQCGSSFRCPACRTVQRNSGDIGDVFVHRKRYYRHRRSKDRKHGAAWQPPCFFAYKRPWRRKKKEGCLCLRMGVCLRRRAKSRRRFPAGNPRDESRACSL